MYPVTSSLGGGMACPSSKSQSPQLVVVALGSALIIACGAWAHQRGHSWFIPFLPALAIVAVVSAYAIGQATIKLGLRRRLVVLVTAGYTMVVTFATMWLSMFVLLNTYGL